MKYFELNQKMADESEKILTNGADHPIQEDELKGIIICSNSFLLHCSLAMFALVLF